MKRKSSAKGNAAALRAVILFGILVLLHWQCSILRDELLEPPQTPAEGARPVEGRPAPTKAEPSPAPASSTPSAPKRTGGAKAPATDGAKAVPHQATAYERFPDARWIDRAGNDGDSFWVQAGGREFQLRLYFVDTPESYLSDRYEAQRRRVREQAKDLGGLTPEQTVALGKRAKDLVKEWLQGKAFTIYTYWEPVFDSERVYGFVELADGSDLGTRLVEQGLARIHTKGPGSKEHPVPTPKGESFYQARDRLEAVERAARQAKRGTWGY